MNLFSQQKPTANSEVLLRLKGWIRELIHIDQDIPISISQLQCREPGCPPLETSIAVLTQPPQRYKIHRAVNEIEYSDLVTLLRNKSSL